MMNTDGQTTCILAEPVEELSLEPAGDVKIAKLPKDISNSEIEHYAKLTGQTAVKLKELAKRAMLGDLVQRIGAARLGSSMLVDSEDMIKKGIELCDDWISDYAHDPKAVSSILKTRAMLVDMWIKAAQAHVESQKITSPDDSEGKPQNTPPPPLVPVQINISSNGDTKVGGV